MDGTAKPSVARSFAVNDGEIVALDASGPARATFDAQGAVVMPGFVDCHTHAVYAGDRAREHRQKLAGATYADIARAGGGIVSTVRAVRAASERDLVESALPRVTALAAEGVTALEIKSGYGLDVDNELKMLRAIRALAQETRVRLVPTLLALHAVPPESNRREYLERVIAELLPRVRDERLADCVDAFIESIAFDLDDARRVFTRARELGFKIRVHAEQLSASGAAALGAEFGALSCDHLEHLDANGARAMAGAGTIAVLLPGAYYFLRETNRPPVSLLRETGVAMAVASDLNPGSSPIASLLTCLHMSVLLFGLTPEEALLAVTYNAARALGRSDLGTLAAGKRADFTVWQVPEPEFLAYQLGGICPTAIFINGVQRPRD
ncbi:MAG TPA: imidazolonepropionase [Steroidobacteraceae bacterium]|nr:imidazolonepropionase [Steroidobacteraceae bacterium]